MARDMQYAYGVSRIRTQEFALINQAQMQQIINAASFKEAVGLLNENNWNTADTDKMMDEELQKAWELINNCIDDTHVLDVLVIHNDFHNLKASIKTVITGDNAEDFFLYPSVYDPIQIDKLVKAKEFDQMPQEFAQCAEDAYDAILRLSSGQIADAVIDKAQMVCQLEMASRVDSELLSEYILLKVESAVIKTALRCARTKKSIDFMEKAMCDCVNFSTQALQNAALDGVQAIVEYLESTWFYSSFAKLIYEGVAAFELKLDNLIMEKLRRAKYSPFGIEPIFAYYVAKETEIKNLRIVLGAKLNNIDKAAFEQKVRDVYV